MICKYCGTQLPDTAKFCAACGNSLIEEAVSEIDTAAVADTATQYYSQPVEEYPAQQAPSYVEEGAVAQQMPEYVVNDAAAQQIPESDPIAGYSAYAPSAAKSKKPLLFIVLGCVVAVIAIVVAVFFTNKASFLKTFMGEEDYAKSVLMDAIGSVASDPSVVDTATNSVSNAFAAASEDYDTSAEASLAMLAMANAAAGVDGVTMKAGFDVRPTEDVYSGLEDAIGESDVDIDADLLKALVQKLNTYCYTATEKTGAEDYQFAMTFGEEKSPLFNVTVFYGADGEIFITFPDATKAALVAEGPELPAIEESETVELDLKQLSALVKQLEEVFDEYYEEADVSVEKSSLKIDGARFEGLCSEIIFEADTMHDMLEDMIGVLSDNDYICDLLEDNIEDFDYEDDFIAGLEDFIEGMDDSDVEFCFRGYVTSANKLAGVELSAYTKDEEIVLSALNSSDYFAVGFTAEMNYDSDAEVFLVAEKTDAKSGVAEMTIAVEDEIDIKLNFEYSDFGTHKAFGKETYVGTFKLLIDSDLIESLIDYDISDEELTIGKESFDADSVFDGAALIIKSSPSGSGIRYDVAFECEPLGYYGVYVAAEPAGKKVASGDFEGDNAIDIDDIADDEGIEFVEQVATYYAEKILADETLAAALEELGMDDTDDLIEGVTGGYDIDEYIERNYGDVTYAAATTMTHTW